MNSRLPMRRWKVDTSEWVIVSLLCCLLTFPHCLHFPFSVRRWTQWWCVLVCSRYCRTPTSRKVGLHARCCRSINADIHPTCAYILHAEHFIRAPVRCCCQSLSSIELFCGWYQCPSDGYNVDWNEKRHKTESVITLIDQNFFLSVTTWRMGALRAVGLKYE